MGNYVSVGIPARNEEGTIGGTLDSVFSQNFNGEIEVLVCANDCCDGTEDVVRKHMIVRKNLRLISIQERGKPNAWNVLRENAGTNIIFFADADVFIENGAFQYLYDSLTLRPSLVAAGAMAVPYFKDVDYLTKLLTTPASRFQGCLYGALYGINNKNLQRRLEMHGYDEMPKDLICEDGWITGVAGPGKWIVDERAKVHFRPSSWRELSYVNRRLNKGIIQLEYGYPRIWEDLWNGSYMGDGTDSVFKKRIGKLMSILGVFPKMEFLLGFLLRRGIRYYSLLKMQDDDFDCSWEISYDSKKPMVL